MKKKIGTISVLTCVILMISLTAVYLTPPTPQPTCREYLKYHTQIDEFHFELWADNESLVGGNLTLYIPLTGFNQTTTTGHITAENTTLQLGHTYTMIALVESQGVGFNLTSELVYFDPDQAEYICNESGNKVIYTVRGALQ